MNYLDHFSEPEAKTLPVGSWDRVVVVPLHDEGHTAPLFESLAAAAGSRSVLAIAVVNGRESNSADIHNRNREQLSRLSAMASTENLHVHVIDRATEGRYFPEDQGVGLARKIGCDVALGLWKAGRLRSPIALTTDGDAVVDSSYFSEEARDFAAGYFSFDHEVESEETFPLLLYEIWLRYYVHGLRHAGSPYAFPTVGSTLALHLDAYEKARGFPRRDAGEDFYLMNKLAKLGPVKPLEGKVSLRFRLSKRVPFGTGAGTRKIKGMLERGETFTLYHPLTFDWLKQWEDRLKDFPRHRRTETAREGLPEPLVTCLSQLGAWAALETAARTRPREADCLRHLRDWFDGFRTLKLVHGLRDDALPETEYRDALNLAPFIRTKGSPREILEGMREVDNNASRFPFLEGQA